MYYDSHTHLNDDKLYKSWETYLQDFLAIWWKQLMNVSVDQKRLERAMKMASIYPKQIIVAAGYHPSEFVYNQDSLVDVDSFLVSIEKYIYKMSEEYPQHIKAIWECGLDYHYEVTEEIIEAQKRLFRLHLDIARALWLPVIIHSRAAWEDTYDIVVDYTDLKLYFHCWGYDAQHLEMLLDLTDNIWIGFAGNTTYPKAEELRRTLKIVPDDKILLETDAPYLAPQLYRGKTNQPSYVKVMYDFVGEFRGIEKKNLESIIEKNYKRLYF